MQERFRVHVAVYIHKGRRNDTAPCFYAHGVICTKIGADLYDAVILEKNIPGKDISVSLSRKRLLGFNSSMAYISEYMDEVVIPKISPS